MKNNISKEQYINEAYKILSTEGIQAISIRKLARGLECNTANLYRYFDGLEELMMYASLKYLRNYLKEINDLVAKNLNALEMHIAVWECYARHSFANPEIFNNMFFGKYSNRIDGVIADYYKIYSDEISNLSDELKAVFVNGNFDGRDYLMLIRCVEEGFFDLKDAEEINQLTIYLYKGHFKDILDTDRKSSSKEQKKELFLENLNMVISYYLKT